MPQFQSLLALLLLLTFPAVITAQKEITQKETAQKETTPKETAQKKAAQQEVTKQKSAAKLAPPHSLTVFALQHASVESVGTALKQALDGRSDIQVTAIDAASNTLFVTLHPDKLKDVTALVKSLDAAPKILAVELLILEISDPGISFEARDIKDLNLFANDLQAQKVVTSREHFRMTALENQKATLQAGAQKSVGVGQVLRPRPSPYGRSGSGVTTQYQSHSFGTLLTLTARAAGEGAVIAEVSVERSALDRATVKSAAQDANGDVKQPVASPTIKTLQVNTSVQVPFGETVLLGGLRTQDGQQIALLRIESASARANKSPVRKSPRAR